MISLTDYYHLFRIFQRCKINKPQNLYLGIFKTLVYLSVNFLEPFNLVFRAYVSITPNEAIENCIV